MTRCEVIDILRREIEGCRDPEICIVYGSAASDRLSESSDIDIAVASRKGLDAGFCLELSNDLTGKTGREVSVLNLERLKGLVLCEILSKGVRIRVQDPLFLSKFIIAMYDYSGDLLPLQLAGIRKNLGNKLYG